VNSDTGVGTENTDEDGAHAIEVVTREVEVEKVAVRDDIPAAGASSLAQERNELIRYRAIKLMPPVLDHEAVLPWVENWVHGSCVCA
jgi:hypothetical protein